jgi:hypothetical protein
VVQEWQQYKIDTKFWTWIAWFLLEIPILSLVSCHLDEEGTHLKWICVCWEADRADYLPYTQNPCCFYV